MVRLKYPLLVWEDHDGGFTARTLDGPEAVTVGATARKAVEQVKKHLEWVRKTDGWLEPPDFGDPELCFFPAAVRPGYEVGPNVRNYDRPLAMRVPAVVGRREDGSFACVLPTLDSRFQCDSRKSVERVAKDLVRQRLDGLEPRELSRFLMAKSYRLDAVIVSGVARPEKRRGPELRNLRRIAEPLGGPSIRRKFSGVWQRDDEIAAVARRLQRERAGVLLVGEGGVGKTAVLVSAIRTLERQSRSDAAEGSDETAAVRERFWLTSGARIIGGMQYLGQWQERCEAIVRELASVSGALCIDSLLGLIRAGGRDPSASVAAFFASYLERGELRMVAEATPAELDASRRLMPGLASLFQIVRLDPFEPDVAPVVLGEVAKTAERAARIGCAAGVPGAVHHLFRRFMPYHPFPGRSVRFVRELFRRVAGEGAPEVTVDHVVTEFLRQTGLPELLLRDELPLDPADVRRHFEGRIRGQPAACDAVARLVTRFKAGLNDPGQPLGVMLFCGPTGVGKTALVKAFAGYLFGGGEAAARLVRLDMSEFAGPGAARRLVLQPDGQPSELIRRIRAQPFSVVLLDEVEKAADEVFDMLLGVFDEGRLTDEYGRVAIFRSAVIVMTSNLGADALRTIGFTRDEAPAYESEAFSFFRPEFFNRFDEVVTFDALDTDAIRDITRIELGEVSRREGLVERGLRLEWSDNLVHGLAERGLDARYGARFLQRTINEEVVVPLSRWLVDRTGLRDATIDLDLGDDGRLRCRAADR